MARIELKNVTKIFEGKIYAVRDLSLNAEDGKTLTLLGPSGCGKSTILRLIAGLEAPDSGEILINGEKVNEVGPAQRDLAMVFQSYALYPHMRVYDNIAIGLKLRKYSKDEITRRVNQTAELLGINQLLARRPRALSGGQRQRVALARAIVREPRAFLLDEPLSNLDAILREKTRSELKVLFRQLKTTALYVTHDQVEAMTISDRVAVLNQGELQQIGTPQEIYHCPVNTFVAGFVGSPRINLLETEVSDKGKVLRLKQGVTIKLAQPLPQDYKRVLVGIRPEDIKVMPLSNEANIIPAEIIVKEPLGGSMVIVLRVGVDEVRVVTAEVDLPDKVGLLINPLKLHFFDTQTGQRIKSV